MEIEYEDLLNIYTMVCRKANWESVIADDLNTLVRYEQHSAVIGKKPTLKS